MFILAYFSYGRWLAMKIFKLDPRAKVPSQEFRDDRDFVPTPKTVVFGHHFTSIAGTGPIVGPAIAIMWGWVPALVWVVLGSMFIGAVHDFGSLVVSLRNKGQTVGDIAGRLIHPRARILFLLILIFSLWIVLAIFGLVIANVFRMFPASILPVFLQIPIAVIIGLYLHRKNVSLVFPSLVALVIMYATVWLGAGCPGVAGDGGMIGDMVRSANAWLAALPLWIWVAVLLIYCYIASVLPVWVLLQPRDYINSLQLVSTLGLILIGLVAVAVKGGAGGAEVSLVAPPVNLHPLNAPPVWPFLFITIACGAISGFHCLVSSGTSSKQLSCETDARFVGYGGMLLEGFLATLVICAVAAGIGLGWAGNAQFAGLHGQELWHHIYGDWTRVGLGAKIGAFVVGAGNFLEAYGFNHTMAVAVMGVMVASFAGTTLDTATRLQRYVIQELSHATEQAAPSLKPVTRVFSTAHGATMLAVISAFLMALPPMPGKEWSWSTMGSGGLLLWPLFGATNQLLGGLAFLVICFWLWRRGKPVWFVVLPAIFMLIMPAWAMLLRIDDWYRGGKYLLVFVAAATVLLEIWMVIEAVRIWPHARGVLEKEAPALPSAAKLETTGRCNC
ncbi:MAG TPA: carbon starvation protein A [Methylothermaceae bacterium]|nr:carbon starvation protein A [Methylothermaceae bacterium]